MHTFLSFLVFAVALFAWAYLLFVLGSRADTEGVYAMCAPSRHANITGQTAAPPRRILAELAAPAGWHDELPIVVTDWLTPVVVESEAAPVVVNSNRTAARFGALELRGGAQ